MNDSHYRMITEITRHTVQFLDLRFCLIDFFFPRKIILYSRWVNVSRLWRIYLKISHVSKPLDFYFLELRVMQYSKSKPDNRYSYLWLSIRMSNIFLRWKIKISRIAKIFVQTYHLGYKTSILCFIQKFWKYYFDYLLIIDCFSYPSIYLLVYLFTLFYFGTSNWFSKLCFTVDWN